MRSSPVGEVHEPEPGGEDDDDVDENRRGGEDDESASPGQSTASIESSEGNIGASSGDSVMRPRSVAIRKAPA